jgi:hypothetical protein
MGIGIGIIGKSKFDSWMEKTDKKVASTALKELLKNLK